MNIKNGDCISVLLKIGTTITGNVVDFSPKTLQLSSTDGGESYFILEPTQNIIMLTKHNQPQKAEPKPVKQEVVATESNSSFESYHAEKIKNLAELRLELAKREKEEIENRLVDHTFSGKPLNKYGTPNFNKIKGR